MDEVRDLRLARIEATEPRRSDVARYRARYVSRWAATLFVAVPLGLLTAHLTERYPDHPAARLMNQLLDDSQVQRPSR